MPENIKPQDNRPVEDIFADIDKVNEPVKSGSIPKLASQEPVYSSTSNETKSAIIRSVIMIGVVVVVLALIVASVYIIYNRMTATSLEVQDLPNQAIESELEEINDKQTGDLLDESANQESKTVDDVLDSDNDGFSDREELNYGTNPRKADTDADGLFDREEVVFYKTNPLDADSDGDGFLDGEEVNNGYDPNGSGLLLNFQKAKRELDSRKQ